MRLGIDASNIRQGGGVTHLMEFLQAARPNLYEIERVIVWGGHLTLSHIRPRSWLTLIHDPALERSLPSRWRWQRFVLPRVAPRHCDILLVPGGSFRPMSLPVVTMCQNMLPFQPAERARYGWSPMRLKLELLALSQSHALREADGVIYLTEFARQTVQGMIRIASSHVAIIPHGISDRFRAAPRVQYPQQYFSNQRPFRLLYVSTLTVYKHQWHVAQAVANLRNLGVPVSIDFIGPAYLPALRRLTDILRRIDAAQEFCRYLGPIEYDRLPSYYQQADAFVFASSCENLPIILLEAMASGLPIVCSNRGPMPEVLRQAGVYFDPEDVAGIATAVMTLLSDVALRQRCAADAYTLSEAYTWERCASETLDFIVGIANRASAA